MLFDVSIYYLMFRTENIFILLLLGFNELFYVDVCFHEKKNHV